MTIISIVSILNKHQKGELYFGIKNDGKVIGQNITNNTIREISKAVSDSIEPKAYPRIEKVEINFKDCVKIEFAGQEVPYYAYGRAYIRVGDENKQLSAKELENIIIKKNKDKLRWDKEICRKSELHDISSLKLKKFLKEAGLEYHSVKDSLGKLGLIKENILLNAAVILFGKNPIKFFPNAKLRCAVFAKTDTSLIIDRQEFEGDLFYLIGKAEEYILEKIHIGMKIEGLRRIDVPEISKEAFRETIINAFCHRDYYEYDSVNIAIFKDRLEIRSPGTLYGGLTIDQIKKEMVSKRRNELIAEMFHRVHFVEKWGRGISLILSKEPDADFKEVSGLFITVFKRKALLTEVSEGLSEGLKLTLLTIKNNPGIKAKEISNRLKKPIKTIERHIKQLTDAGEIERKGSRKTGGYYSKGNK